MANATVIPLDAGRRLLEDAASGLRTYQVTSFEIGRQAGFEPSPVETRVRGVRDFVGNDFLIQTILENNGVVRHIFSLPENVGPFYVGNILVNATDENNDVFPIALMVMPYRIIKRIPTVDLTESELPYPGNRLIISLTIRHVLLNALDERVEVNVQVVAPEYSNLAFFESDLELPDPSLNPWGQFVVHNLHATGAPGLVTRTDDGNYWVNPFTRNIKHPRYGVLSGGITGDSYKESRARWLWGHLLSTDNSVFPSLTGGRPLSLFEGESNAVGGLPLSN